MIPAPILTASIAAFISASIILTPARAAEITWDPNVADGVQGGAGSWDNITPNWTTDGGATRDIWNNTTNATATAVFSTAGGTVTLVDPINLGGLKFATAGVSYTITGATLAFGSVQGSIDTTALGPTSSVTTTIASALTGSAGLNIAANGNLAASGGTPARLIISGDNTGLSGGIAITAGLVEFTSQNAAGSNALALSNNAGIVRSVTSGALTLSNNIDIAGGGTIRNWNSAALNLTGVLSGSGILNITDTGVTTLGSNTGTGGGAVPTTANTFSGKVIVNGGGTLGINSDSSLGGVPGAFIADSIQLGAGSTLMNMIGASSATSYSSGYDITLNANRGITLLTGGGKIRVGYNKTLTVNGVVSGAGSLSKSDNGILVLNAANTYTGATNIVAGLLRASSLNSVAGGAASSALGAPTTVAAGTIGLGSSEGAGTLSYTGAGETTDRVINLAGTTNGGTLEQAGAGLLKFTSNFTATGAGNKTLTLSGSTAGAGEISGAIANGSGAVISLTKAGNGVWTLSGANTYGGATNIQNGTLKVSSLNSVVGGSASSSLGAPATVAAGTIGLGSIGGAGTLSYTGAGETTDRVIDLPGTTNGGTIEQAGAGLLKFTSNFTATGVGNKTLTLSGSSAGAGEISGAIVDNSAGNVTSVTKAGTGTWTLSGTSTYSGATTISGGVLSFSNIGDTTAGGNLGTTGTLAFNGGTLRYTGGTASTSRNMTTAGGTGGTFEITEAATNFTLNGTLSNGAINRLLTKAGPGTLTLAGTGDNNSGRVIVNAGTLVMAKASSGSVHSVGSPGSSEFALVVNSGGTAQLAGTGGDQIFTQSSVQVNAGGTLDMNGRNEGFATLSDKGSGGLVTNTAALTTSTLTLGESNGANASSADYTFSGVIEDGAGKVALNKVGTGTQVLSGMNTYTGATTVSAGTLLVSGSIGSSAVTVNGGTLGGSGTVGTARVNAGGTLAPGLGILSASDVTFSGGTFALEIAGSTAGSGYSQLNVTGTISLTANTPLTINLGLYDPVDGVDRFTIIKNDLTDPVDAIVGLFSFGGEVLGEGALFTVDAQSFTITYSGGDGNDVVLAAVPEPGVAASMLGGLSLLLGLRRRRR